MKNILTLVALSICISMNAQIGKGAFMAGGSLTFNHHIPKGSSTGSTNFNINPNFGYFFTDNFVAGLGVSFNTYGSNYNVFYISPYMRYYVKKFYLQSRFDYGHSSNTVGSSSNSNLSFDLGYALFLNNNVALEPAFYYLHNFNSQGDNLGFKMGLQIYFNR
jgi:hypothetical protein